MTDIRILTISGSPYEMGYTHGKAFAKEIGDLTEERLHLSCDPFWTGGQTATLDEVLAIGRACLRHHEAFAPELMEEMRGMADATGIGVNELVIMNGFTDFVDIIANPAVLSHTRAKSVLPGDAIDCTAFLVAPAASAYGHGYLGQTWDMHSTATPYVLMLDVRPQTGPALMTFTITGCVAMIGMNEHGVAVGINNLLGAEGRAGVHWVYVVRKMLAQRTVEEALTVLQGAHLSGAHNYLLLGPDANGALRGYNVEHMATRAHVIPVESIYAHTNHCLIAEMVNGERPRKSVSHASTVARQDQASRFLEDQIGHITVEMLMALTRYHADGELSVCAHVQPGYDVESSGACVMSPTTRELWALWGNPCRHEYEAFSVASNSASNSAPTE
ncbi:C45 family peptidase [Caldilinea sp.]|uniref:C45 family peptidase n=1 Tax=Caldilinea sp. TaxID=2293560 RepID=UPI002B7BC368|nr:C45 family autoproteolytic acyltransferase/hydrolase [Caldilinea sp.]